MYWCGIRRKLKILPRQPVEALKAASTRMSGARGRIPTPIITMDRGGTQPRRNLPTCLKGLGISPKSAAVERLAGTCKNRVISFGKGGTETVGRQSDNKHHRRITTQSSDSCGIDLSVCAAAGDLRRVLCTHPTSRLRQCCANGAEHHGARTALSSGHRQ